MGIITILLEAILIFSLHILGSIMPKRFWLFFLLMQYFAVSKLYDTMDYLYNATQIDDNNRFGNELNKYVKAQSDELQLLNELNLFNELIGVNHGQCGLESHNILLIAGSGDRAFGSGQVLRHVNALKLHGAHQVTVVGDGTSDVDINRIFEVSKSLRHDRRPVTVIIMAHGIKNTDYRHLISLEQDKLIDTCELLEQIKNELGDEAEPSFFLESCFGGTAVRCASNLGNSVVSLAGANNVILSTYHIGGFIQALESAIKEKNGLSAKKLLEIYLLNMEGARLATLNVFSPMFASSTLEAIDLKETLNNLDVTQVSNDVRTMLHNKFDKTIGKDAVTRTLYLMSSGKNSYLNWISGDLGKALLFSLEIQENKLRNFQHNIESSDADNRVTRQIVPKF